MKRIIISLAILLATITVSAQKVNVAAAANLRYVLEEIKTAYLKQNPKAKVNLTFGASGTLVQQIQNGASFDFFMAADNEFPLKLKEKGLTTEPMSTYAFGKLAIYSTTLDVSKQGLDVLKSSAIKKIAIANPETAPYGERAVQLLKSQKLYESLKSKIVLGENISQTAQFAFTGNAEIGFVALSLALAPDMAGKGDYYIVPQSMYQPIEQACILIKTQVLNTEAAKFKKFVLSPNSKAIWEKWGYGLASGK
ncbi:molybdenum ABC transporter, periplasmic molybdate-binding protein [Paludibacter propionicigenes WB4]|uniref:Molybdenum ABC transporter, periplasmic molybdate-binding protein n=1 Tax=Paludibacter propionicigenes (strain DSM 17365 / JCM 13257 / WB4) TaxID=694427 RepID=E4T4C1_PALPW|nr:molybdate ABC transporter substrate-binding protein [Paludibacter propionicigenes]ADQ79565.1 molybdenum ABC transporter, periplasmic molybdate-binding protein [Paludibacter propionicigenes WB4]